MSTLLSLILQQNVNIFYLINSGLENQIFNFFMPLITDFGSIVAWTIICILLYLFGGQNTKKVAILGITALLFANLFVYILKVLIAEPRPFMVLPNVNLLITKIGINSFPSGHTASSFAAATVIGLKIRIDIKGKNYRLIYPLLAFAVLIGFSMIYIGVHYPLDVIIGGLIGIFSALLVLKLWNNLLVDKISKVDLKDKLLPKKFGNKNKQINDFIFNMVVRFSSNKL